MPAALLNAPWGQLSIFSPRFGNTHHSPAFQKKIHSATLGQPISVAAMSILPPPTPPSRALTDDERRFKTITLPCEWVEDYRPGGYHPVVLGEIFNNGQYRVMRKLGEGSYSTVWLARDLK